jgi:hypothetical protein
MHLNLTATRNMNRGLDMDLGARAMPPPMFEIFVDDDRYAVPTLHFVTAEDDLAAEVIARRMLAENAHHLGAEVCRDGNRILGVGSFATRQLPPGVASRRPDTPD